MYYQLFGVTVQLMKTIGLQNGFFFQNHLILMSHGPSTFHWIFVSKEKLINYLTKRVFLIIFCCEFN